VDTWGWLALGHRRDSHHASVAQLFQSLRSHRIAIHTTDYVFDELITLLFSREVFAEATRFIETLFSAADLGQVILDQVTSERFVEAWELRKRFQDKPRISFTDLSSMAIMAERGIKQVITDDDHFLQVGMGFEKVP
jgi:predicted nucleic acid-binding protein